MDTLARETPQPTASRRPRRTWLVVLIAGLAIAGLAIGTSAVIEANQTDDLAIATEFADTADIAWVTGDGDDLAALFTEDGIWEDKGGGKYEGRDAISRHVSTTRLTEMQHGAVTEIDDGVFAYTFECDWSGATFAGETHITLNGDLVSYAEVVKWERVYEWSG